jgi:hypothetical protein
VALKAFKGQGDQVDQVGEKTYAQALTRNMN